MITETHYRSFQKRLKESKQYRYFWQSWSNYAFVVFIAVGLWILFQNYLYPKNRHILFLALASFLIARGMVVTVINWLYHKQRPYQKFAFDPIVSRFFSFHTKIPNSFPSRHTTAYFSVASVICLTYPTLGVFLFLVSGLAGAARVVLGYHWPIDIIAGAEIGTVVGCTVVLVGQPLLFT